jgi:uncharacterized integral membrane protein
LPDEEAPLRRLSWILTLPITVLAVMFALSNSETVTVALWWLWTADLPLYLLILGSLLLGFLIGAVVAWVSGAARRRRVRALTAQVRAQADEITALNAELARSSTAGPTVIAALPSPARAVRAG